MPTFLCSSLSPPPPHPDPAPQSRGGEGVRLARPDPGLFRRDLVGSGRGSPSHLVSCVPFRSCCTFLQLLTESDAPFSGRPRTSAVLADALSVRVSRGLGPSPSPLVDSLCCPSAAPPACADSLARGGTPSLAPKCCSSADSTEPSGLSPPRRLPAP